jgi:DNA-binding transcriptional regulator YiaG
MANIGTMLKHEIARIARRECNKQITPIRKVSAAQRHDIAALKRTVRQLQQQARDLTRTLAKATTNRPAPATGRARFRAAGVSALRKRLGLSARELGLLLGVSEQSIYNWQNKTSTINTRRQQQLGAIRRLGKREVRARLAELTPKRTRKARR